MNLDATGQRMVVKGRTVTLDGRTGLVRKVSRGNCLVKWEGEHYATPHKCEVLHVQS